MGWFIAVFVLFLAGILFLSSKGSYTTKPREQFLQELVKFLEGKLEMIEEGGGDVNAYRILFTFNGEKCIYEDYEKQGFKDKVYKAYIRINTPSRLTLIFKEKRTSSRIRSDIFKASEVSSKFVSEQRSLEIPNGFQDMEVSTNDPISANQFFAERKVVSVLKKLKNKDSRGYPFLAVQIVNGTISLEFYSEKIFTPNLLSLWVDTASIEDYLEMLIVLARKLKDLK